MDTSRDHDNETDDRDDSEDRDHRVKKPRGKRPYQVSESRSSRREVR